VLRPIQIHMGRARDHSTRRYAIAQTGAAECLALMTPPVLVLFLFRQRTSIAGISAGAVE